MANYTTTGIKELSASWSGGAGRVVINGNFSQKTKVLLMLDDGSGWVTFGKDAIFTYPGAARFEAAAGDKIGILIAPTDDSISIDATIASLT